MITARLKAGARTYTLEEVADIGERQGFDLLGPYPPDEWHQCRPPARFINAYWDGFRRGLRRRWSPVYLVQCVTCAVDRQRLDFQPGKIRTINGTQTGYRKGLAAEIRRRRAQGELTRQDNRESFFRMMHNGDYPHCAQYRDTGAYRIFRSLLAGESKTTGERLKMTTTKHTPGPWHLERQHPNQNATAIGEPIAKIGGEEMVEEVEFTVGRTCDFGPHGPEQTEANARLVAAAPELLEAVNMAIGFCVNARQTWDDWEDHMEIGRLFGLLTVARDKAIGAQDESS